ncbi:ead/Ea22-like family protein [Salmonella enterica]|nr:ead/Ea22-like family protein [Salmonella enterica]
MTIDKQALRISELEELNELLREKVKKLESDLWDKEQLRKVYSEKSFNLDSKVRELEARNQKDFVWRGNEISRLNDEVDELKEKLEAAERSMAEQSAIVAAAEKLVRCKGRYHSELNYRALAKLFGVITPDLPPLVHENVHYADAAEVEITALRQRIQELEAKLETADKLQDSAFRDGLKAGFSYGQTDDQSGFAQCMSVYSTRTDIGVKVE